MLMKVNFLEVSLNFNKTLASNLQSASQVLGWTGECWNWAIKSYPVATGWGGGAFLLWCQNPKMSNIDAEI